MGANVRWLSAPFFSLPAADIDLAVGELPKKSFFPALARLSELSPYPVDLKPLGEVRESLKRRIEKGIVLYEAG